MKKHRLLPAVLILLCAASLAACVFVAGTVCPTGGLIGIPCPLCGMSRAMIHAVNGDLWASLDANPALVFALAGVGIACVVIVRRMDKKPVSRAWYISLAVCAAVCAAVYVWRMIVQFPDHSVMSFNERAVIFEIIK